MARIHIAMVGETTENIVNGVIQVGGSELYPIVSEKFKDSSIPNIRAGLPSVKIHRRVNERELVIDPFSDDAFFQIVGLIVDIVNSRRRENDEVWVNITGGTNLMSAAAAMGAMMTESRAYYVTQGKEGVPPSIIELPFMIKSVKVLENVKRKRIGELLVQNGRLSNDELARDLGINKKSISKHVKILESHDIVKRERRGRHVINELTDNGKITIRLFKGGVDVG